MLDFDKLDKQVQYCIEIFRELDNENTTHPAFTCGAFVSQGCLFAASNLPALTKLLGFHSFQMHSNTFCVPWDFGVARKEYKTEEYSPDIIKEDVFMLSTLYSITELRQMYIMSSLSLIPEIDAGSEDSYCDGIHIEFSNLDIVLNRAGLL